MYSCGPWCAAAPGAPGPGFRYMIRVRRAERSFFVPARAWLDGGPGLWGLHLGATHGGYTWGLHMGATLRGLHMGATLAGYTWGLHMWATRTWGLHMGATLGAGFARAAAPSLLSANAGC